MVRLLALALVAAAFTAQNAVAANPVDVLVDSGPVALNTASDGSHTAKIVVSDLRDTPVVVQGSLVGQPGCTVTPDPSSVNPGNRTEVKLTLDSSCTVTTPAAIRVGFTPNATPASVTIAATSPPGDPRWGIVAKSFGISFLAALVAIGVAWLRVRPIALGTELKALGTSWSFKDNWIGNVTVGATVLVALFASSSTFGAVIGPSATPALTAMTVAAAIAAVFVGLGPLIVKFIGHDLSYPTVLGTLLAGFVTLFGTLGQVTAMTWEVYAALSDSHKVQLVIALMGAVVGGVVLLYAVQSLWFFVTNGVADDPAPPSDTLKAATIVASAIESAAAGAGTPEQKAKAAEHAATVLDSLTVSAPVRLRTALL